MFSILTFINKSVYDLEILTKDRSNRSSEKIKKIDFLERSRRPIFKSDNKSENPSYSAIKETTLSLVY